jgi:tRNA(Ile2) C34 agmatinyltransferase TiaS
MGSTRVTDYHDFTTVDTPKEERARLHVGDVWRNEATCGRCGETVRSRNRHDFRTCSCGDVSVDGGSFYCKRSLASGALFTNNIEMFIDARGEMVE